MIMEKKERKILVAVDESKESMFALSWCITNLISCNSLDGYLFYNDVISDMEKYNKDLVNSIMERAGDICKNLINTTSIKIERVVGSTGDANDVICSAVQKLEVDTLVMGTHSYGFFKRYL